MYPFTNTHTVGKLPPLQLEAMDAPAVRSLPGVEVGARWWCRRPPEASICTALHCLWTPFPDKQSQMMSFIKCCCEVRICEPLCKGTHANKSSNVLIFPPVWVKSRWTKISELFMCVSKEWASFQESVLDCMDPKLDWIRETSDYD